MSDWRSFFDIFKEKPPAPILPGQVSVNFVNRYLEPLDGVKYKIVFDGSEMEGTTTIKTFAVLVAPKTVQSIKIYAWSKQKKVFKLIDTVVPKIGAPQLVYERMNSFRHPSNTHPHPQNSPAQGSGSAPSEPANSPATAPKAPSPHEPTPAPQAPSPAPATAPTPGPQAPLRPPAPAPAPQALPRPPVPGPSPTENQGVNPTQKTNPESEPVHHTDRPISDLLTTDQLKKIFPAATDAYVKKVVDELNTDLVKYKLDTILRKAHFFAQIREEAGVHLEAKEENLDYKATGLLLFKYYQENPAAAQEDSRHEEYQISEKKTSTGTIKKKVKVVTQKSNPERIANRAYAHRLKNGDEASGDGWRYRGRGIIQITFRANYTDFQKEYSLYWSDPAPDFVGKPEMVKDFPYCIRSAVWFWCRYKVYLNADKGSSAADVTEVTRKINAGLAHNAERQKNFLDLTYPAFK